MTSLSDRAGQDLVSRLRRAGCVFAEDEARLLLEATGDSVALETLVHQRISGRPLEQVLGWAEFCGLRITVAPGVFVPRRRTELLVDQARGHLTESAVVAELCCGSGAVSAALLSDRSDLVLYATDIDPVAIRCAQGNLRQTGATVAAGDLFAALPSALAGRIDLIVANAPYVPTAHLALMPPEARDHESVIALDGGPDGLDLHRRIAAGAPRWLSASGRLLIETSETQAEGTRSAMRSHGLTTRIERSEELDATVVVGSRHGD